MNVCVVTRTELGWDCVVGVYYSVEEAVKGLNEDSDRKETKDWFSDRGYVFTETQLVKVI